MQAIPLIRKKIGNSNLVWFENSNSYVQLEEPAWYVVSKTARRCKPATIAKAVELRYCISASESQTFVNEILTEVEKLNRREVKIIEPGQFSDNLNEYHFTPYTIHSYLLGDKHVTFSFESRLFEHYIHPLISHLETGPVTGAPPLFELFAHEQQVVFRFNGEVKGVWTSDETHLMKGLIFMVLINVMHGKTDSNWLMTVHASAITNKKKTILFSAPPGHGKTTIAALMQSKGYELISDDFVPIDNLSFNAWPFPIAMSVKQGSMEVLTNHFPTLKQKKATYISPEKSVRYLAPPDKLNSSKAAFPVHELVFIEYNTSIDFRFEKLDPIKGLKLLLDQAWIVPAPDNAKRLLELVPRISFFNLTYSDTEKALEAIAELFNHE